MLKNFKKIIEKYKLIVYNDKIVLGLSGGADSVCLLYLLVAIKKEYNLTIYPVHINHNLRENDSLKDELFVQNICQDLNLEFFVYNFDVKKYSKKNRITIEEAGRKLRYDSFYKTFYKVNANKIATAHNKNDQAETLLMRFFRGTGLKGLAGIKIKDIEIIRPLLSIDREKIENYCHKNNIKYINDKTNKMVIYTRNKIRLELIPYIKSNINNNIIETLSSRSKLYNEEDVFLENLATKESKNIITIKKQKVFINIENLKKIDDVLKRRVIRIALKTHNKNLKNISMINIEDIISLIDNKNNKMINLPNNIIAKKQYNDIIIFYEDKKTNENFKYDLEFDKITFIKEIDKYILISRLPLGNNACNIYNLVYTKIYSYDTIMNVICLRNRQAKDKMDLKVGTKKIKDIFIDDKVPLDERDKIPLLADGSNIIWIINKKNRESITYKKKTDNIFYVQLLEKF